jgi:peroxiredoxin
MNFRIIIFFIFFTIHNLFATSKVNGIAKTFSDKTITFFLIDEFLTNHKTFVSKTKTDSVGNFSFTIENTQVNYIQLLIDDKECGFYITPNINYEIDIVAEKNSKKATIVFYDLNTKDFNFLITDCKNKTALFLDKNIAIQGTSKFKLNTKQFADSLIEAGKNSENELYTNCIVYHCGTLEVFANTSNKYVFDKYVEPIKIDYNNSEFFNFLNSFFDNYFEHYSENFDGQKLEEALTFKKKYAELDSLLIKDKFLKNQEIRQLVAVKSIVENLHNKNFNTSNLFEILSDIESTTSFNGIKKIIKLQKEIFENTKVGNSSFNFCLSDANNLEVCLSSLKTDKFILLEFTSANNIICRKEMTLTANLKKKFSGDVEFISVLMNDDVDLNKKYLSENVLLDWIILLGEDNYKIKQNYNLSELPTYFILDNDKKILLSNASKPSERLETILTNLIEKKLEPNPTIGGKN